MHTSTFSGSIGLPVPTIVSTLYLALYLALIPLSLQPASLVPIASTTAGEEPTCDADTSHLFPGSELQRAVRYQEKLLRLQFLHPDIRATVFVCACDGETGAENKGEDPRRNATGGQKRQ